MDLSDPFKIRKVSSAYILILTTFFPTGSPLIMSLCLIALAKGPTASIKRNRLRGSPCRQDLFNLKKNEKKPLFIT